MGKNERITIVVNAQILKKLRNTQAKQIAESEGTISFSRVINEALAKFYKMPHFEY